MAEVIWTEPALSDLDAIADYIALENPEAAQAFVRRVFEHVGHLETRPDLGGKPKELRGWRFRQIVESPCRVLYRHEGALVYILHVVRGERLLRPRILTTRLGKMRRKR